MVTERLLADQAGIERAAQLLQDGQTVAFPTETVYGLGADAMRSDAVARIYAAKSRPSFNPLIAHVPDLASAHALAVFDDRADRLARAFWPGPLTLVLPLRAGSGLSDLVTAGLPSVGVRVPDHPLTQAVLRAVGRPLAAPSANPSGRISPTTADHVLSGLSGQIAAVLDGGATSGGIESTILSVVGDALHLLRPGGIPAEAIRALGIALSAPDAADGITAPGQLASHYAPTAPLRLNVTAPEPGALWLGFGPRAIGATINLSPKGDLIEAAAQVFSALHKLDAMAQGRSIHVSPIPNTGVGVAINDRLRRAAAPRG